MRITLKRLYKLPKYTIGKLYIDGRYFCDTLEDTDRDLSNTMSSEEIRIKKIPSLTAIPYGTYKILLTYSPKFKKILPLLINVPGYLGIRIHSGNTEFDTEGCILLGKNTEAGKVTNSRYWVEEFIKVIKEQSLVDITIQ